ncbi:hypothetical protein PHLGIDRAFT_123180 [Phlebiopsis gigantea 11061_1 CR5-6]|uniref:Uncharacterized protein n=1 Tax=Phlebiopsis gigantea (strain 11061_1 CR5-6) TaxID=745531 RepID=A0A0C3RZ53_PHLG1|nr:hypothetical protein PHLGIDRAFT_123180 [Phlebiopsis gigantea 11061_1 CR5-6]
MASTPTSSPPPSPIPSIMLQATTSLEIALDILLSNSQPITIRNALAAYIHAADFSPDATASGGRADAATVEDAIVAFEHALDKHPLPFYALPLLPSPPSQKKKRAKTKKPAARPPPPPGGSTQAEPVSYRRPYIDEIDKLRREYYTEKVENAMKMGSYPCSCGKCGDAPLDLGGYLYDAVQRHTGFQDGQCVGYEVAIEYGIDPRWGPRALESGVPGPCGLEGCDCETYYAGYGAPPPAAPKRTKRAKGQTKKRARTRPARTDPFGPSTSAVTL